MKLIYILILFVSIFFSCKEKNIEDKSLYDYKSETTINTDSTMRNTEKFNRKLLESDPRNGYLLRQDDGYTLLCLFSSESSHSYEEISQADSYYSSLKRYYPISDKIKEEGMIFTNGRWETGIWKFYDEEGMLTHTIDYDKPFTFPIEKVMKYAEKQGFPVGIGYRSGKVEITRFFFERHPFWTIKDNGQIGEITTVITLDGKTGKETHRESYRMRMETY